MTVASSNEGVLVTYTRTALLSAEDFSVAQIEALNTAAQADPTICLDESLRRIGYFKSSVALSRTETVTAEDVTITVTYTPVI